ncbi:type II DNA modification (Methyltransferase subunit) [Entomoplasma ellychniae]|uniref:site-specific DNA-methyltransferase (adenine-specific) n=1 Tax=Entomoplasma ellychniae TaxID=2114 RepID=A0A8E2QY03_9MOLU|nr:N-6 DNA methylase [Entomoplasma ellychniae]PPE04344.1 type II DNA modification (Methyltransferase subunit) [Entomoplasma ellychniae]PPE04624.1 type II DNA modification (Methyltransferase subunit) [Entomoplasma ellychniae]PPE04695.1 type II DNA modification (Methyltransferase subunit) [Entomoplasma ellychniae]
MKNSELEFYLHNYLFNVVSDMKKRNLYKYDWNVNKSDFEEINSKLSTASKNLSNSINPSLGKPDLIYFNPETKLLILGEIKNDKKKHTSNKIGKITDPKIFATDGVLHYMSFFKDYDVFGIAASGSKGDYIIDQFYSKKDSLIFEPLPSQRILNEFDYENIIADDLIDEKVDNLSDAISSLNKLMDDSKISTEKRPIITGSIIFSLTHFKQIQTDIEKHKTNTSNISGLLISSIKTKMLNVLPENKRDKNIGIIDRFCNLIESYSINNEIWKKIIDNIDQKLMPIINKMKKESYHDFSGDMYRVLLRYTSGDGKILGQVLTPKHIANLMIDLAELKKDDSVIDPACGTGIFLVNSMNKLISMAKNDEEIETIKSKKIYGIEISKEMFFLTLVNMLINDDGKTNIFVDDDNPEPKKSGIFKYDKKDFVENPKKVIMNPPYLSQDEMWKFINKSLTLATEKVVIIVSTSIFKGNTDFKREFLKNNSLMAVINMPNNIFQNKSSSGAQVKTSILVADIGRPNSENYLGTYFYDLKDDGFISSKKHGRYDGIKKWSQIKSDFLENYKNRKEILNTSINIKNVSENDTWNFNFYNKISSEDFLNLNDYLFNLFEEIVNKNNNKDKYKIYDHFLNIDSELKAYDIKKYIKNFKLKETSANEHLEIKKNINNALRIEKYIDIKDGDISYVAASNSRNGCRISNIRNIYNESVLDNLFTWNTQGDGGAGLAFFHPYKFIVASTCKVFDLIDKTLSLEHKIFIAFAMSLEHKNRYFGYSISEGEFKNGTLKLTLPVNNKEEPDWNLIYEIMVNNPIFIKIKKYLNLF